jgi:GT2 family glycosyltransferase/glycosyltransferase involved in cell wall biosynthesis
MSEPVLVAIASGSEDLIPTLIEKLRAIGPDLPLYLVSEFQEPGANWIPYRPGRTLQQNLAAVRSSLTGKRIVHVGLILQPRMPYWTMRALGWKLGGLNTIFFNENLDHFMLRPRALGTIARHCWWRTKNFVRWELRPGGATYTFLWRLAHPGAFIRPLRYRAALNQANRIIARRHLLPPAQDPPPENPLPPGVTVVIPSRNGRELLARLLPGLMAQHPEEVIVVDNGSGDGTAEWLAAGEWGAAVSVIQSAQPLSFARAVNRGIAAARFSHVLMLNNDMVVEPGFLSALRAPFETVPGLFCSTAQIFFPAGVRRQETGKAVMPPEPKPDEFPVTCRDPIIGEDHTYVMYGSGGCSLFDTRKLRQLGGLLETYEPAYVEDLDLGFRGWQRGWATVFAAGARVEHRHRSTTSRYYSEEMLARVLEVNLLKFIAGTVTSPAVFKRLWRQTLHRLNLRAATQKGDPAALEAITLAARSGLEWIRPAPAGCGDEDLIAAIGSGELAVFPGQARRRPDKPAVLIASPYLPFPLTHGGAVRMYNLLRRAARDFDLVLVCFVDELAAPPPEVLELCVELVEVRRSGRHDRALTARPDTVEEFDTLPFRAALRQTMHKWKPALAQLEYTQMAVYANDCRPAPSILVEHDVTFDLYAQFLQRGEDWETRQQFERWLIFEKQAWQDVDAVVVMSEKDRATVQVAHAVTLANGVDLERFTRCPDGPPPEPRRVLFIGAFSHLPNILALEFFLRDAWPRVLADEPEARLHVIAGRNHRYFLERARDKAQPRFDQPGIEIEDFVPDPRIAYRRAEIVIAPLLASAGTNIKIMEAMAMGRAIVSTPGGVNGLGELRDGHDVVVRESGEGMAAAIVELFRDARRRCEIECNARASAERWFSWDSIAERQCQLYRRLLKRVW